MVLSNPVIEVDAVAEACNFLWTKSIDPDPKAPPQVAEHGREYDRLVEQDGKWLIEKRVVIADSALPALCGDLPTAARLRHQRRLTVTPARSTAAGCPSAAALADADEDVLGQPVMLARSALRTSGCRAR